MECSDIVSNSNYNIMIKKLQLNGNSISSCLHYIFYIFIFNILYINIFFAEKSFNEWFIDNFTNEGDFVFDPFFGCGTTGVACVNYNRNWGGVEIVPEYIEIARKRIKKTKIEKKRRLF